MKNKQVMVGRCMSLVNDEFRARTAEEMQLNEILLSTIDDVLNQVLNEESTKLVYMYMNTVLVLDKNKIIDKPEVFETGLRKLLGKSAYDIMTSIVNTLYYKLGLQHTEQDSFKNHINRAKKHYLKNE